MVYLWLPVHPAALSLARDYVRDVLTTWGREDLGEDAELIATELSSNAIKAMGLIEPLGTVPRWVPEASPACESRLFCLGLYETCVPGKLVVLEVWDSARTPPKLIKAGPDELGGRGLSMVDHLAESWGYRWLSAGGKVVWAALGGL
ncbi:ATP-binding protein [Nonomuraea sp. NPDC004580]|uniref:ATP-binding protein n=1 Tax=Nonomuraea sp. NPDC004580 TaxID=3154552 RepID=UPI0033BC3F82